MSDFLLDPPIPVPDELNLPARGVVIRERPDGSGIHDVWDHVGSNHYPNVFDFICEVGNLGLSRHVSSKIDFSLITKDSLIILAHERGIDLKATGGDWLRFLVAFGHAIPLETGDGIVR